MKRILLLGLFLLFAPALSSALTLSQLRTEVRKAIDDQSTSRPAWTNSQLNDYLNEAQREVTNAMWLVEDTTQYVLSPRTTYYLLPNDVLAVLNVDFRAKDKSYLKLEETNLKTLRTDNPDWRNQRGSPTEYYVDNATGTDQLLITYIGIPTEASTGTVILRYAALPDDMSSDSDVPFDGRRELYTFHMSLVYHVAMRISVVRKRFEEATFYGQMFTNSINMISQKAGARPNYTPSFRTR